MAKKDRELTSSPALPERKTSATKVYEAIKAGGATKESLMEVLEAKNTSSLYGQISYLITRALNKIEALTDVGMRDAADALVEFPLLNKDGTYSLVNYPTFAAAKTATGPARPVKKLTAWQFMENAQKRLDRASKSASHQRDAFRKNPSVVNELRVSIAETNHKLAQIMLEAVVNGDYQHERGELVNE